jgi:hypothetical protein
VHPDFYPFPATITTKSDASEISLHKEGNFLKKAELIDLYGKCGDHLHKGTLKKLFSPKTPIQVNFYTMVAIAQKFENLSTHTISRLSGNPLICIHYWRRQSRAGVTFETGRGKITVATVGQLAGAPIRSTRRPPIRPG